MFAPSPGAVSSVDVLKISILNTVTPSVVQ